MRIAEVTALAGLSDWKVSPPVTSTGLPL